MGKTCAVPGCKSSSCVNRTRKASDRSRWISLFSTPKNDEKRDEWGKILGCELKTKQFICQLHFDPKYIRRSEKITLKDGTIYESPRDRRHLVNDALPTLEHIVASDCENDTSLADKSEKNKTREVNEPVQDSLCLEENKSREVTEPVRDSLCPETDENFINEVTVTTQCPPVDPMGKAVIINEEPKTPEGFTMKLLEDELRRAPLPESWAWTVKSCGITFTLLDAFDFHPRVQLEVAQNLSVQIRTITDTVIPLIDPVTCMTDVYDYLSSLKNRSICKGTGIEEQSRDHRCIGILEDDEEYQRVWAQPRCTMCRGLRKKIQRQTSRRQKRCDDRASREKSTIGQENVETKRSAKES